MPGGNPPDYETNVDIFSYDPVISESSFVDKEHVGLVIVATVYGVEFPEPASVPSTLANVTATLKEASFPGRIAHWMSAYGFWTAADTITVESYTVTTGGVVGPVVMVGKGAEAGGLFIGIGLCLLAACTLALSMNVQCYALSSAQAEFDGLIENIFCGMHSCMTRNRLWSFGLLLYAFANMFYVVGLGFAPLSLMSALFATVLVFNALFANRFLGEALVQSDMVGLGIIVASVGVCGYFGPTESTQYSANDLYDLTVHPIGIAFWLVSLGSLFFLISKVNKFEDEYPDFGIPDEDDDDDAPEPAEKRRGGEGEEEEEVRMPHFGLTEVEFRKDEPDR
jgi:hypothetical protein